MSHAGQILSSVLKANQSDIIENVSDMTEKKKLIALKTSTHRSSPC